MVQGVIETVCKIVIDILNLGKVFPSVLFEVTKIFFNSNKTFSFRFQEEFSPSYAKHQTAERNSKHGDEKI